MSKGRARELTLSFVLPDHAAPPRQPHPLDLRSPGWYALVSLPLVLRADPTPFVAPEKAEKEEETVDAPTAGEEAV